MKSSNLFCIILFITVGCELDEPDANDHRVIEAVHFKLAVKIDELQKDCKQVILEKAEMAVDSTLRAMALSEKLSVFNPPTKPSKPTKPMVPEINDSLEIKPFDRRNLGGDSSKLDTIKIED